MKAKNRQIMDAAHQLFIDKGFALTSIQDILDKAGVAKGTFYNYFNSKNECLRAILESIAEEVDHKRREIAIGREDNNEEVFVEQLAVRMNMSRQHHLLAVFETVSFSKDAELKAFIEQQHRIELQWVAKRLSDLYPPEAQPFTLDHAVMLMGIIHHMMIVGKFGSKQEMSVEKIIRYALTRVQSMLDEQMKTAEALLPENWLGLAEERDSPDMDTVIKALKKLQKQIKGQDAPKQKELVQFLLSELQAEQPRTFLLESVLLSFERSFAQSGLEQEAGHVARLVGKML